MSEHAQVLLGALGVVMAVSACAPREAPRRTLRASRRVVCLGDSITDGCTYPQLIMQALREAGRPAPAVVCAGVASDTAAQMAARVEETVLVFQPTLVTFSAGTNDALRGVSPGDYEKALRGISAKVKARGVSMILLTPCIVSPAKGADAAAKTRVEAAKKAIAQYIAVIRTVAADGGYPVAENNALMRAAREAGRELMAEDWWEQERRNGFGLRVHEVVGKGLVQAVAAIECAEPKAAFINTGIGVSTVWLNGKKLHEQGTAWTGFHAGKERLPASLRRGRNVIVVEIDGPQFFLSVTDKLVWEGDIRFEERLRE